MLFLSSVDNLLQDAYILLKGVDNFEIELKTCLFLVKGVVPPLKVLLPLQSIKLLHINSNLLFALKMCILSLKQTITRKC